MVGTPTSRRAVYYFADYEESKYQGRQRITRQHVTLPETVPTLIIVLQRMSRSIQTKEACPPVITAASPVTFDPNVHSSRSRMFRGSYQQELHQALYLRWLFRLHGICRSLFLPIRVPTQRRTN
jgi:hypothetical protein